MPIAVATLLISVGLDFALIPPLGIDGATVATDAAYGFYVLGHLSICKRLLDLPLRPVVRDLARALAAAAVMCGVMALFGTEDLGVVAIVLGSAAGVIALRGDAAGSARRHGRRVARGARVRGGEAGAPPTVAGQA